MYCKVEDCIYNISGTCGIDTEIDENGKCVWMGYDDEPQIERTAAEQLTEQLTEQPQMDWKDLMWAEAVKTWLTDCENCAHHHDGTAEFCRTCGESNFTPMDEPQIEGSE